MGRYGDEVTGLATPLVDPGHLDVLLDRIGDARVAEPAARDPSWHLSFLRRQ